MSYVYLIEATESRRLKIGVARDPLKRLATLQTGCPELLALRHTRRFESLAAAKQAERRLHKRFELFHIRGEWFHGKGPIIAYFATGSANPW